MPTLKTPYSQALRRIGVRIRTPIRTLEHLGTVYSLQTLRDGLDACVEVSNRRRNGNYVVEIGQRVQRQFQEDFLENQDSEKGHIIAGP